MIFVVFETAKLCGVEQRAPPMFGRATITLGIGPNSSCRCFQDGGRPPSYLLCVCLDHPRRAFGGLYRCAKFGLNRCSSFDNMHVLSISRVWLENAYSRPQNWGFWGILPPKRGGISTKPQKGTSLGRKTSYDV